MRGLYRAERDRLLTSMSLLLGDVEVAHTVTEETFSRAFRRRGRPTSGSDDRVWLYSVALRRARANRSRRRLLRRVDAPSAWRAVIPAEHVATWQAVLRLRPEVRRVVVLCTIAGLSDVAVGRRLRIPLVAVHANLWAGLREMETGSTGSERADPAAEDDSRDALRRIRDASGVVPAIPGVVAERARARRNRRKTIIAMAVLVMIVGGVPPLLILRGGALGALAALFVA